MSAPQFEMMLLPQFRSESFDFDCPAITNPVGFLLETRSAEMQIWHVTGLAGARGPDEGLLVSVKANSVVDESVGAQLSDLREARGLDYDDIARGLNVDPSKVRAWEAGSTRLAPNELFACARFFDVSPSYFFKGITLATPRLPGDDYDSRSSKYL